MNDDIKIFIEDADITESKWLAEGSSQTKTVDENNYLHDKR